MDTKKTIKYGLRNIKTGEMLGYEESSNCHRSDCNDTTVMLSSMGDEPWLVDNIENVFYAKNRSKSEPWYSSSLDKPMTSNVNLSLYEIVSVEIIETIKTENVDNLKLVAYDTANLLTCHDAYPSSIKEIFGLDFENYALLRVYVFIDDTGSMLKDFETKIGFTLLGEFTRYELIAATRYDNKMHLLLSDKGRE